MITAVALLSPLAVLLALAAPAAAQLLPHRALYALSLADQRGDLASAEGAFAIEFRAVCNGFTTQQRLWFLARTKEGGSFDTDVRFTSWESSDVGRLGFAMQSFSAGELVEEYRGRAFVGRQGEGGRAFYTVPEPAELILPPGTLFPTAHLQRLLRAAVDGRHLLTELLFDGSGAAESALNQVTAAIAAPVELGGEPAVRAWPMALAYHDPHDHESIVPVFELRFVLTEQGLMRDVVLDYGDFALKATLGDMDWLPASEGCG